MALSPQHERSQGPVSGGVAHPGPGTEACEVAELEATAFLEWFRAGGAWLGNHVPQINALNVFPVPDGDTGTNMSLTMQAALREIEGRKVEGVGDVMRLASKGALMGARGNSGVILSQILRGFGRELDDVERLDGPVLARALTEGASTAYRGVMKPVEGTMLTVIRDAAEAAEQAASAGLGVVQVLEATLAEARRSLDRTPTLLPVLADAGVVDAGGQGLCCLFEGMWRCACGLSVAVDQATLSPEVHVHAHAPEDGEYNYDTQFVILSPTVEVEVLREAICGMGDSVLVVGDAMAVKVHVHSDWPGQVIDYAAQHGQLTEVVVENLQLQYKEFQASSMRHGADGEQAHMLQYAASAAAQGLCDICVVAVASGEGMARVFGSLGVDVVVPGGQTMNPSTEDLLRAIDSLCCDQVVILPNNKNILLTARQTVVLTEKKVAVVPTESLPQGVSAMLAFNFQSDLEANAAHMAEASRLVRTGEVTEAVRSVRVNGLSVTEGQYIGLVEGDLVTAGSDLLDVVMTLLEGMHPDDAEIVTIYHGADTDSDTAEELAARIGERYGDLEMEIVDGGQAHYHFILGVE